MKPRSCKILRARRRRAAAQACGHQLRSPAAIFFPTAPSHMSSATVKRPAPIARQRACGAQRGGKRNRSAKPTGNQSGWLPYTSL